VVVQHVLIELNGFSIEISTDARLSPAGSGCISIVSEASPTGRGGAATEAEEALTQQLSESRLQRGEAAGTATYPPEGQSASFLKDRHAVKGVW
jgi:hypothetical protein